MSLRSKFTGSYINKRVCQRHANVMPDTASFCHVSLSVATTQYVLTLHNYNIIYHGCFEKEKQSNLALTKALKQ